MSPRLSVVMIAKNAADLLPDCLASVSWADEIVLLDSGGSDNTVELARSMGVQVHVNRDWQGYGIQRQRAQDYATGDYVLMIDTDERVTPELAQSIRSVLAAPQTGAIYSIARRNYFLGRFMRHSGWYPDRVMRLYERGRYRYNDNLVHESLDARGAPVIELAGDRLSAKAAGLRRRLGAGAPSERQKDLAGRYLRPYAGRLCENAAAARRHSGWETRLATGGGQRAIHV